jgi:hypothetical protein
MSIETTQVTGIGRRLLKLEGCFEPVERTESADTLTDLGTSRRWRNRTTKTTRTTRVVFHVKLLYI